jgi:hypothetical protein
MRHPSSAMRFGIAVVALPRLGEKSLSRAMFRTVGSLMRWERPKALDPYGFRPGDHE